MSLSIGIVAQDEREYYAINRNCRMEFASDWVRKNVISQLPPKEPTPEIKIDGESILDKYTSLLWKPRKAIASEIISFVGDDPDLEFWAYYADYDWVVFCQLFGTMMDLPKGFPMYCRDIKQECDRLGNPQLL